MKIAFINTWAGGAIYNVFHPLVAALQHLGHEVEWGYVRENFTPSMDCDVVHFNYFSNMLRPTQGWRANFKGKVTATLHHAHPEHLANYSRFLHTCAPARIHVMDPFALRQLQQMGHYEVEVIPQTFDHTPYKLMPLPDTFTAGFVGCDYNTKRFDAIVEGCGLAGVPYVGVARKTMNEEMDFLPHQHILDTYAQMSCYVVASYNDGGPLPPQEALLCGRPVATTHVGMMPQVILEHLNGTFHNGSPRGIADALLRVRDNLPTLRSNIERLVKGGRPLPMTEDVAHRWVEFFERARR